MTMVEVVDRAGQAYPGLQGPVHVDAARPGAAPYLPSSQDPVHKGDVRPALPPYRPAGHCVHTDTPPRLYCPATQTAAVAFVDPGAHAYPAAQGPSQLAFVAPNDDP